MTQQIGFENKVRQEKMLFKSSPKNFTSPYEVYQLIEIARNSHSIASKNAKERSELKLENCI